MGHQFAPQPGVGKQSRVDATYSAQASEVPGKRTLMEQLYSPEVNGQQQLLAQQQVAARAGETITDGGKFVYAAQADGSFKVISAPTPFKGRSYPAFTLESIPVVWHSLFHLLMQKPASTPARPTASPNPAPAPAPAPAQPTDFTGKRAREAELHSESNRKLPGTPLEIANTRAEKGDSGTHYHWDSGGDDFDPATEAEKTKVKTGAVDADAFWCSGLVVWSLVAAGYNIDSPIGTYIMVSASPNGGRRLNDKKSTLASIVGTTTVDGTEVKATDYAVEKPLTPHHLIEGMKEQVAIMSSAERRGVKNGVLGVWRKLECDGFKVGMEGEATESVKGAAGAFELAGIGTEVAVGDQRPGDFAQIRRHTKGQDHVGKGHAYQVWSVHVKGAAMFGQPGSPQPTAGELVGWHTDVEFVITKDTSPDLVGPTSPVIKEQRLEANTRSTFADKTGDGGVHITAEVTHDKDGFEAKCFYGRLASSPWTDAKQANEPQAPQEDRAVPGRAQSSP